MIQLSPGNQAGARAASELAWTIAILSQLSSKTAKDSLKMPAKRPAADLTPLPPAKRQRTLNEFLPAPDPLPSLAPAPTVTIPPAPAREPPAAAAANADSTTTAELKALAVADALAAWTRLRDGYTDKSGLGYPAAIRAANGCLVCQKAPNRAVSSQNGPASQTAYHKPLKHILRGMAMYKLHQS